MKILVLSDSHSSRSFMRFCVDCVRPDHIVHLGDHYEDGVVLSEEYPHIRFHQVPGNCDRFRVDPALPEILRYPIAGVTMFMTHGHKHSVKLDTSRVIADARRYEAAAVLFGHTHCALCYQEADGLWVLNPGSCGTWGGSVGLLEVQNGKIIACRVLRQAELELMQGQA